MKQVHENFWNLYPSRIMESINWLPFPFLFDRLNRINNGRFAKCIREAAAQLGFDQFVLFNDNDMFRGFHLKEMLQPEMYIYYSRDNLIATDYFRKHGMRVEPLHIARADLAVANSLFLRDMLAQYNPNSHYIGQGCDLRLFDPAAKVPLPADMHGLQGPLIGYVGALTAMRLDPAILMNISKERPAWNIVLVGPEDEAFQQSPLHQQSNVHFLGRKSLPELPAYIQYFDVCLNPQLLNQMTMGNYPLKVDEYLAMGKPVVATATKTMSLFKDHVYLAGSPAEYVYLIEQAMAEDLPDKQAARTGFARSHTWENSVGALYEAMEKTFKRN
jgi:glycosyltransferase involved in cell wall biosynthesis